MSRPLRSPSRAVQVCAGVLFLIALTCTVGWALGNVRLRGVGFSNVAMNPLTAVCFAAAAAALLSSLRHERFARAVRLTLGAFILSCGALRVIAYSGGWDAGCDGMLFARALAGNHMAPNTAWCFTLLGSALVAFDVGVRSAARVSTWLLLAMATIAWLALVGYTFGVLSFYRVASRVPMALPTALGFVVAYTGACCARPEYDPMAMLLAQSAGGALARRMLPFALIVPVTIGWLRLEAQRRGMLSTEMGVCVMVATTSAAFLIGLWWCGRLLHRMDNARVQAQNLLRELSLVDELTGLRNRRGFLELAAQQLRVARRQHQPATLFFMDLDGLKHINDVQGHAMGDQAIMDFGELLRRTFRTSDIVARLGGDEFVVLVDSRDTETIVARLRKELKHYNAGERRFQLNASVGAAVCDPSAPRDIETLLSEADSRMYAQKKARPVGRDRGLLAEVQTT